LRASNTTTLGSFSSDLKKKKFPLFFFGFFEYPFYSFFHSFIYFSVLFFHVMPYFASSLFIMPFFGFFNKKIQFLSVCMFFFICLVSYFTFIFHVCVLVFFTTNKNFEISIH